jgi:DNA-binding NarL/FixJ family response regulator
MLASMRKTAATCNAGGVSLRVLIVDDCPSFLAAARVLLEREGISVAGVASTVADALREAEHLTPELVLVDITLADESGFELARRLAEQDQNGAQAVVLISTRAEADFADLIAESPAAAFLPKSALSAAALLQIIDRGSQGERPRR